MAKALNGSIFAVPLPDGAYVFGRVLLDVRAIWKQRLLPHDSPILYANDACLVEMYSAIAPDPNFVPSQVLFPSAFVESREIGKSWRLVSHVPVNVKAVEFPETLIGFNHPLGGRRIRVWRNQGSGLTDAETDPPDGPRGFQE